MAQVNEDYEADVNFGKWLRDQRICARFSLEDASDQAQIPLQRLKALETGFSARGISRPESERLCKLYRIVLRDFLDRAAGGSGKRDASP